MSDHRVGMVLFRKQALTLWSSTSFYFFYWWSGVKKLQQELHILPLNSCAVQQLRSAGCSHSSEVDHRSHKADSSTAEFKTLWSAQETKSLLWDSAGRCSGFRSTRALDSGNQTLWVTPWWWTLRSCCCCWCSAFTVQHVQWCSGQSWTKQR